MDIVYFLAIFLDKPFYPIIWYIHRIDINMSTCGQIVLQNSQYTDKRNQFSAFSRVSLP